MLLTARGGHPLLSLRHTRWSVYAWCSLLLRSWFMLGGHLVYDSPCSSAMSPLRCFALHGSLPTSSVSTLNLDIPIPSPLRCPLMPHGYSINPRACTVCRRLKMKCVGAENGPPCKRCIAGKHQCIFEESNRGKRTSKKHEVLTKSIKKMEQQLETVMRSLKNPTLASIVAANGGIPGIIPSTAGAGNGGDGGQDDEVGSPSESLQSLPPDERVYGGVGATSGFTTRRSFDNPVDNATVTRAYQAATQQQLTRNTENLTSRSPVLHSPPSPRLPSGAGLVGGMSTPLSNARGSHSLHAHTLQTPSSSSSTSGSLPPTSLSHRHPSSRPPHSHALHHISTPYHSHLHHHPDSSAAVAAQAVQETIASMPLSPRLNSLPDNALNPLGLLAEASLANRRVSTRASAQEIAEKLVDQAINGEMDEDGEPQGGSASIVTPSVSGVAGPTSSDSGGAVAGEEDSKTGILGKDGSSPSVRRAGSTTTSGGGSSVKGTERKVGVANETYFRPGPMNILPLRRLFIERQVQPEMLSFVSTEEVIELFKM